MPFVYKRPLHTFSSLQLWKTPKMDLYRKRMPDYSELAYREAVAKLKYLLAESYTPVGAQRKPIALGSSSTVAEKDWSESPVYPLESSRFRTPPEEVPPYLRRQEEYIEHLEKEGQLYREELSRVLDKVKEVVGSQHRDDTEEEDSDKETKGRSRRGPSIVYSSRISELEAQLTQCKLELRKAHDEASYLKAHSKPIQPPVSQQHLQQLESIQRERDELNDRVSSLQNIVSQLRDKEASASEKAKRSLDVVDQAQFDKNQLEMEVRRLRSELDRMSEKQREALQDSARRVSEAERRYAMQMERLNSDLAAQWDAANRLNLELDRARRTETELRRELAQKAANMEELKKELTTKTGTLQTEALTAGAERESLEAELSASRLATERAERQGRQETARLQAEVQALRARLDRADQDLLYSRKENIRLADVIAGLEKELSLAKLTKDSTTSKDSKRADELTSMIKEMDAKHAESVSELEGLIQSQTELMEKLNAECQGLTRKLEESAARHKEEMAQLQNNIDFVSRKLEAPQHNEWRDDDRLQNYKDENGTDLEINSRKENETSGPSRGPTEQSFHKTANEKVENLMGEKQLHNMQGTNNFQQRVFQGYKQNNENNTLYPQEVYKDNKDQDLQKEQPHQENSVKQYGDEPNYNKDQTGEYKHDTYDQTASEAYNQGQEYDQSNAEKYNQGQEYDQSGKVEYDQGQEYDQSVKPGYNQDQKYDQSDKVEYDQGQEYDQSVKVGYNQGQEYDQSGNVGYNQGQGYDQGTEGEYSQGQEYDGRAGDNYNQGEKYDQQEMEGYQGEVYSQGAKGYEHGQEYIQPGGENPVFQGSNEGYGQGQPYDQQGEVAYDQNQLYEQQDANYTQDQGYDGTAEYSHDQAYDQTGAEQYDQNQGYSQVEGEGYNQGQEYEGTGETYPSEVNYQPDPTNQAYVEGDRSNYGSEGYIYEEKK
ncbi:serologically defined colon cancer antigen 8 isoform X2 [Halyomorpha halys]|uniref:serologically defined colon cancer antigen 8 isoform X2 n=1 Tax=Halyomorpha halys TaxID=286706 RepID=UPI0006D4CF52|nr:golgin subfamily A member 3 isoform X2 [Halyomorpha halys]